MIAIFFAWALPIDSDIISTLKLPDVDIVNIVSVASIDIVNIVGVGSSDIASTGIASTFAPT